MMIKNLEWIVDHILINLLIVFIQVIWLQKVINTIFISTHTIESTLRYSIFNSISY